MRSRHLFLPAFLLATVLLWSAVPPSRGQGATGAIYVSSDYELFGLDPLNGGGHVTWTLTGAQAQGLRAKIIGMFDEYARIPRGFTFGGAATGGNGNGAIEAAEGVAYTDRLENELEGTQRAALGTQIGYFYLDRSDLFDKDPTAGFQRSTSGILGTTLTTDQDLQIRFLFNGYSNVPAVTMPIAARAYVDALFDVFAFEAAESPTFTPPAAGYSSAWPLLVEGGWHVVPYNATASALWAGNVTSCAVACRYDADVDASARTSIDPVTSLAPWLDLRFASSAAVTFEYTGRVASGAQLLLQAALGPTYTSWSTVANGSWSPADNTVLDEWRTVSVDLGAYLAQKVQLRLRFVSGPGPTDEGFFVRGFAIHAPSAYSGSVVQNDAHYLVGALSFSNPEMPTGGLTVIRTPGGEILFDSLGWDTSAAPTDGIRFETFNAAENPQILFAVMIVACYLIARFQDMAWDAYREAHPALYRPALHPAKWIHWLGRAAILLLILFYFVPTAFFAIGLRIFLGGLAYWVLAAAMTFCLALGTRAYYQHLLATAPPLEPIEAAPEFVPLPPPPEPKEPAVIGHCTHCLRAIKEGERTYTCSCGSVYHGSCAGGLMRCTNCRKPLALGVIGREERAVSMRCQSCGEVQSIAEGEDPRTVPCASCGGNLRPLDSGKRYLLVASNPAIAFNWMKDLAKGKKPVLCITTATPDRLRLEFGLKDVTFLQVSSEVPGAVDPKRLDPQGLKSILPLAREGKGGVLLYDGLDQVIAQSTLGDVVRFLRKANDMAFVHGVTVIARVGPGLLAEGEVDRLSEEFDEVLDLSARL
jgi:hypothetical protein